MAAPADPSPWVIVAGGFHQRGGMDRANAALAAYLLEHGVSVHLVGHEIDEVLLRQPRVRATAVPRPRGLPLFAERLLSRNGVRVAREAMAADPGTRVVVNGGNCPWPDINWVHAVHAAWPVRDDGAPWWTRYRNRRLKNVARLRERTALRAASLVIANSDATRRAVVDRVGVNAARVRTVYLGSDPAWGVPDPAERAAARASLGLPAGVPVVLFVGALGTDINKGFDLLWSAWQQLTQAGAWDAHLVVLGGGWRVDRWRAEAVRTGAGDSVHFLGFTETVGQVLAAGDLLVSPVRYEAYGLNVQEALCRGLPVMVTRSAGIVERFDGGMSDALLPDGAVAGDIADRLRTWRGDMGGWRMKSAATAAKLRAWSWRDMAAELVGIAQRAPEKATA